MCLVELRDTRKDTLIYSFIYSIVLSLLTYVHDAVITPILPTCGNEWVNFWWPSGVMIDATMTLLMLNRFILYSNKAIYYKSLKLLIELIKVIICGLEFGENLFYWYILTVY